MNKNVPASTTICDGCNVNPPWEHRCHGEPCSCDNPVCMEKQGKITQEELLDIVNRWIKNRHIISTPS